MPVENDPQGIEELNSSWPGGDETRREGDDHIRNIKLALGRSFPGMNGPWSTDNPITHGAGSIESHSATLGQVGFRSWGTVTTATGGIQDPGSGDWTVTASPDIGGPVGAIGITFNEGPANYLNQTVVCTPEVLPIGLPDIGTWNTVYFRDPANPLVVNFYLTNDGTLQNGVFSFERWFLGPRYVPAGP